MNAGLRCTLNSHCCCTCAGAAGLGPDALWAACSVLTLGRLRNPSYTAHVYDRDRDLNAELSSHSSLAPQLAQALLACLLAQSSDCEVDDNSVRAHGVVHNALRVSRAGRVRAA